MTAVLANYLTQAKAAKELHQTPRTLRAWRARGEGPAYVKIGRKVYYSDSALAAWLKGLEKKPVRSAR